MDTPQATPFSYRQAIDLLAGRRKTPEERLAEAIKWLRHCVVEGHGLDGVPAEAVTAELLALANRTGYSVGHNAAAHGLLRLIAPDLLTREFFAQADHSGFTVGHSAACTGHIDQVPLAVIDEEFLTRQDDMGQSALSLLSPEQREALIKRFELHLSRV